MSSRTKQLGMIQRKGKNVKKGWIRKKGKKIVIIIDGTTYSAYITAVKGILDGTKKIIPIVGY